jgi:hypothetical protein
MVHRNKKNGFSAFLWHRRAGLAAIILLIIMSITGIMLNHTESLKLDETYTDSSFILNWYELDPAGEPLSFKVANHQITQWEHQVFFDDKIVTSSKQIIRGAVESGGLTIIAFDSEIILLTENGAFVDRMPAGTGFSNIQQIGTKHSRPVIRTEKPETKKPIYYIADEEILKWDTVDNAGITWSQSNELNETKRENLRKSYRGEGLTLERVILDLHSGRILGQFGVYLMDAAAIALIWLSISGLWIWLQRSKKEKQKRHYQKHHRRATDYKP